jgi:hypothetical protein
VFLSLWIRVRVIMIMESFYYRRGATRMIMIIAGIETGGTVTVTSAGPS